MERSITYMYVAAVRLSNCIDVRALFLVDIARERSVRRTMRPPGFVRRHSVTLVHVSRRTRLRNSV